MARPRKWRSGPPPSIGWWIASAACDEYEIRWWDGKRWSIAAWPGMSARDAAKQVVTKSFASRIEWQNRPSSWPQRSRT